MTPALLMSRWIGRPDAMKRAANASTDPGSLSYRVELHPFHPCERLPRLLRVARGDHDGRSGTRCSARAISRYARAVPHLVRIALKHPPPEAADATYPFSVPQIRALPQLDLNTAVTFFVGENGSGKSTLLEGIAVAAELPAMGATRDAALDPTLAHAERLGAALRLAWSPRSRQGFFLRAEDFFGRVKGLARNDARLSREKAEALADLPVDAPRVVGGGHPDELAASAFLPTYDSRSHGESFMDLFTERVRPRGLYLLDEPEAPLSPKRQIEFLGVLIRAAKAGAQFIIATHSPILLACPGARILSFDRVPIAGVAYAELEHVTVTREFLNDPKRFM
jgi:predicted ATPase